MKSLLTKRDYSILNALKLGYNNKEIMAYIRQEEGVILTGASLRVSICKLRKAGYEIKNQRRKEHYHLISEGKNKYYQKTG